MGVSARRPPRTRAASVLAGVLQRMRGRVLSLGMASGLALVAWAAAERRVVLRPATAPIASVWFRQDGGHLLAVIDPRLLGRDFVLPAQIAAAAGVTAGHVAPPWGPEAVPVRGKDGSRGVFRMLRAGDSLIVLRYAGTVHGQFQYRPCLMLPILRGPSAGPWLVDGAALWHTIEPSSPALQFAAAGGAQLTSAPAGTISGLRLAEDGSTGNYRVSVRLLPPTPMRPRLRDWRIRLMPPLLPFGPMGMPAPGEYIWRWRLAKQDTTAPVSAVVRPIVVQIADNVPRQWIPYITQGVTAWNPVFAAIGFRQAIVVRSAAEAADSGGRIQITWVQGGAASSTGHDVDPRTGEILGATIQIDDSVAAAYARIPVVYGALSPRVGPPFPDTLLGRWLSVIVAHEMGHALGLDHNPKGATAYPTDSLRSRRFVHRVGAVASIMASQYVDWIAQPEDHIPMTDLISRIGAYDRWAIAWAYRPIPNAPTPEAERPTLLRWLAAQDTAPYLRTGQDIAVDPNDQLGVLGNDPVTGAGYAMQNLAHAAGAFEPGRDAMPGEISGLYGPEPRSLYTAVADQWAAALAWALGVVGGAQPRVPFPVARDSLQLRPLDSAQQIRALHFVLAHGFDGQDVLVRQHVLGDPLPRSPRGARPVVLFDTVAAGWQAAHWRHLQQDVLRQLVNRNRLARVPSGVHRVMCQVLRTLDRRLAVAAGDSAVPVRQQQAQALRATVAKTLAAGPTGAAYCPD